MPKRFPCALQISPSPTSEDMQTIKKVAWTHDSRQDKVRDVKKIIKNVPTA